MKSLFAFGLNHHNTPVDIREKVVFDSGSLIDGLADVAKYAGVPEVAIVSTCNRTEVYCGGGDPIDAIKWLAKFHKLDASEINPYIYLLSDDRAVSHAFRVASGLDSMIIGEPQILGQIKQAVKSAETAGTMGTILHKLFQKTFSVAKKVRSQTDIGSHSISMASIAVGLGERVFPDIKDRKVLCLGAGEMVELFAARFFSSGMTNITFANRSLERAQELAGKFAGNAISLNDVPKVVHECDLFFCCTASQIPVLGKGTIERAIKSRKHEPMVLFDLGVPRDIEPEIGMMDDVFLYTIDDLGEIAKEGVELRRAAVDKAENIITSGVDEFMNWLGRRNNIPIILSLQEQMEHYRETEVERAIKLIRRGDEAEKVLEEMSRALVNKVIHGPITALSEVSLTDRDEIVRALTIMAQKRD